MGLRLCRGCRYGVCACVCAYVYHVCVCAWGADRCEQLEWVCDYVVAAGMMCVCVCVCCVCAFACLSIQTTSVDLRLYRGCRYDAILVMQTYVHTYIHT